MALSPSPLTTGTLLTSGGTSLRVTRSPQLVLAFSNSGRRVPRLYLALRKLPDGSTDYDGCDT